MLNKSQVSRFAFTIFVVAAATSLRFLLIPVLGDGVPFILFFPAVVICAWYGGLWQGFLTALLGAFIAWYIFIPPAFSFTVSHPFAAGQLIVFLFAATLISLLAESLHRAKTNAESSQIKEREERERFRVTLSSIGDAVIATDDQGRVTFINPIAESLTGWGKNEALRRPLQEVFNITTAKTRMPVENPALRAIKEGRIFGLANHTILIAKNGTEIPINDSGAPIRDAEGNVIGAVLIFRDITERKMAEERFRLAVESAPNAMVMVDEGGLIVLVNSQTEQLFGYTREELIGKQIELLIPERFRAPHLRYRAEFLASPQTRPMGKGRELYGLGKNGTEVPIEIGLNPITVDGKTLILSAIVDISERKSAEEERLHLLHKEQAARAEAEAANLAKDIFLASVTHELRTPLNAISGWVDLLSSGTLDASTTARGLETLKQSVRVQSRLVDDLLDISRMLSGKLELDLESVDLVRIIEMSAESVHLDAQSKSIQLDLKLDPAVGSIVGDSARLHQVIWNLLTNSLKFTPSGGCITIHLQRSGTEAYVKVIDTGKGIDKDFLPYLFEKFYQGKDARQYGGLGLGLSIVRRLVEMHGGSVQAESPGENLGTTFTVVLPLYGPQAKSVEKSELPPQSDIV